MTTKPLRVLVVDDQLEVAQSLASVVRTWQHEVEIAYSGEQALEVAERFQPHAIMLDIMMPGMDGYAVAQKLRAVVNLKECTIIGVTALGDQDHRHQGWDSGFVHYMTKPIDPPALKKVLEGIARTVAVEEKRRARAVADLTAKLEKRLKAV
jgi:DNA-binding response OmpR family regulator